MGCTKEGIARILDAVIMMDEEEYDQYRHIMRGHKNRILVQNFFNYADRVRKRRGSQ